MKIKEAIEYVKEVNGIYTDQDAYMFVIQNSTLYSQDFVKLCIHLQAKENTILPRGTQNEVFDDK